MRSCGESEGRHAMYNVITQLSSLPQTFICRIYDDKDNTVMISTTVY